MDSKKSKEILRKHKKPRPPSSSDSSSSSDSESGSSSDSFSSSSSSKKPIKRRTKRIRPNHRSSSSSDEERARKREKHACHKKLEAKKNHLKRKLKEAKAKKRALSPSMRRRSLSPTQKMKKMLSMEKKHHGLSVKERIREKEREREREREREKDREREKEREKLRIRERERIRSRSPKNMKSRSPKPPRGRESKRKSPIEKHHMSPREKLICQIRRDRSPVDRKKEIRRRHEDSREREKRERERAEREEARNKERAEALARCQERQRERERLAREKLRREKEKEYKGDRLLPRPAEREMAIAAARGTSRERSLERDSHRPHPHSHNRPSREPVYERGYEREREYVPHEHRVEKEDRREHDREYLLLRRREIESPPSAVAHYSERVRGGDREMYPEEQKYEREHPYMSRNYISSPGDAHRRETNWERDHDIPREREIDHGKHYSSERPSGNTREWAPVEDDWRTPKKDHQWEDKWQRDGPPEENWEKEDKFRPHQKHDWENPRMKHEIHREEHQTPQPHTARRWPPQEWRGRPNEERPNHQGPMQPGFHHNLPSSHQVDYPLERPEPIYRRQHPPKPLIQQHISHPPNYHIRPHFPPKRQMTYINPNQTHLNQNILKINTTIQHPTPPVNQQITTHHPTTQTPAANNTPSVTEKPAVEATEDKAKEKQEKQEQEKHSDAKEPIVANVKETDNSAGQQTSTEEPIRDDLSEISDDADEILNKDEETNKGGNNEENWDSDSNGVPETEVKKDDETSTTAATILPINNETVKQIEESVLETVENKKEEQQTTLTQPISEELSSTKSDLEVKDINDDILDFEEISDGELEEDARTKGLGDALGVDWASLVEESKFKPLPIEKHTTTKQKWQPHRVILDVGISLKYAGEEFAKKLINDAKMKLAEEEEEQEKNNIECKTEEIKKEDIINDDILDMKIPVSEIKNENDIKGNVNDELKSLSVLNAIACVQITENKNEKERKNLVFNACGTNSRALSARKDLKLRRQLCGLPVKEIGFQRPINNHLKDLALKAFQKALITEEVK